MGHKVLTHFYNRIKYNKIASTIEISECTKKQFWAVKENSIVEDKNFICEHNVLVLSLKERKADKQKSAQRKKVERKVQGKVELILVV